MTHKTIIISSVIVFFLVQTVFGAKADYTSLEDLFEGIARTEVESDGAVLIVDQVVKKLEYKIGEKIMVTPELVNIGNKSVTIIHQMPLFLTEVKYQNGSIVWPPYGHAFALIPVTQILDPNVPITEESGYQNTSPIILELPGKYNITSIAHFTIGNDEKQPFDVIWSKPLEITVLPENLLDVNELSPLKQFRSGISINEIKCKSGLELIIKSSNNTPACVKSTSISKLVSWGWAKSLES